MKTEVSTNSTLRIKLPVCRRRIYGEMFVEELPRRSSNFHIQFIENKLTGYGKNEICRCRGPRRGQLHDEVRLYVGPGGLRLFLIVR